MQSLPDRRQAAIRGLTVFVLASCALTACRDITPTSDRGDTWQARAVVSMQVRGTINARVGDQWRGVTSFAVRDSAIVLPVSELDLNARGVTASAMKRRTVVKHHRDNSGVIRSLAFHYERDGLPPQFVYSFVDGRIESVVHATYTRHGKGVVRSKTRITFFDKRGEPSGQLEIGAGGIARTTTQQPAYSPLGLADVVRLFSPKPLFAEEYAPGCLGEYLAYLSASAALALANALLGAAAAGCPETGVTCLSIEAAIAGVLAAITAWNKALDLLLECEHRRREERRQRDAASSPEDGIGDDLDDSYESTDITVNDFIDKAISSGNFWCSADGNYCVYYAAS